MRSLPIVCSVLLVCGVFTTGESAPNTPNVVIDGYTVNSTLDSPATLQLGTTVILVCRLSGIPQGLQTNYHWTCPNGPCQQTGYAGRKINNTIIAIHLTSTSDGGIYTCTVTVEGREASQQFQLNVTGGQVVHSYGRLIFNERVITDKQQLQPPNNDGGDGRIECRVSSGGAGFSYHGRTVPTGTSGDVHQIRSGSTATVVIRDRAFDNFVNFEGNCAGIYHYLFLSNGTLPDVSITGTTRTDTSTTVNIGNKPTGIARVIIGYYRLDLGLPVVGEYVNHREGSKTFFSLVPGAKYRITAWGLGGSDDRRTSQSPAVREVTTMEQIPSPPRHLIITRVFDDGIELNWIPPREPNGHIRHYIIKYTTQDGTQQEINTTNNINCYNLTGLERGQTYNNIRVVGVNSAGGGGGSTPITIYVHTPTVESTKSTGTPTPSSTTSLPPPATSTPYSTTTIPFSPTSKPSTTSPPPGSLLPTIAGVLVAAIVVLILMILVIIVVVLLIKHKRATNRSHTVQVYNDVVDHYDTVEDTKPETVYYSAVREPPRDDDDDDDSDEGIVEDKVGHLYDDVNKPTMELQFDQETQEYDDIVSQRRVKSTGLGPISAGYDDIVTQPQVKITGLGPISAGYEDIVTQPRVTITGLGPISAGYEDVELVRPNTAANIKQTTKMKETKLVGDAVYAVPDMSKKKGMKEFDEDQEMDSV